jgi:hypothetical protein
MPERLASGLSRHPRVRQEHPVRVRGEEQAERTLQARIPLRTIAAARRSKPSPRKLSRPEKVIPKDQKQTFLICQNIMKKNM